MVDRKVGVIGTHNFDPRSESYNTEAVVVIEDPAFAGLLASSIEGDIAPGNAWVVAPRKKLPGLYKLNYSVGKLSEALPVLDLWPWRYATNYEFKPGLDCPIPLPRRDRISCNVMNLSVTFLKSMLVQSGCWCGC